MPLSAVFLLAALAGAEPPSVSLQTSPRPEEIRATEGLTHVVLEVRDGAGAPVRDASLAYVLRAPARSRWISTDVPVVEGTQLLSGREQLANGRVSFDYRFPLRGTYLLTVAVTPEEGPAVNRVFAVRVGERSGEARNLAVLLVGLLGLGLAFGVLFARAARARRVPRATFLGVLLLLAAASPARAHDTLQVRAPGRALARDASGTVQASLEVGGPVRVGVAAPVRGTLVELATGRPVPDVLWEIAVLDEEHGDSIFRSVFQTREGSFVRHHQFTDGAPHRVVLRARPAPGGARSFSPVEVGLPVRVQAIQPPTPVVVRTLALLVGVAGLGLVLGVIISARSGREAA
jgi:hypothetical protein